MEVKNLDQFVVLFAEQFDDTPAEEFFPAKKFRETDEWSSLIALSVIAMVDEVFGVTLKGDDIRLSETVEDIYKKILEKL